MVTVCPVTASYQRAADALSGVRVAPVGEAFRAVLNDIRDQGIREIYCLGDVIGYGPNPVECLEEVMRFKVCILGNHDQAALFDPEGFNPMAPTGWNLDSPPTPAKARARCARPRRAANSRARCSP